MLNDFKKLKYEYVKQEIKALITPTEYNRNLNVYILVVLLKYA